MFKAYFNSIINSYLCQKTLALKFHNSKPVIRLILIKLIITQLILADAGFFLRFKVG